MAKIIGKLIIALSLLMVGCASNTNDVSEAYKGESSGKIFAAGESALVKKNYNEAIKRFEALDVQYPYAHETELASLHIIYAYYMNSDYLAAISASDRFIHSHPTSKHVDYALYVRGLANYFQNMGIFERLFAVDFATRDLSQIKKCFEDFTNLTTRFPNSVYAPSAHQYRVYLRNVLARHQLEVADFYFQHKAYIAAVDRASLLIQHYQGSPAVPAALVLQAKSYRALHLPQEERAVLAIIDLNYPSSHTSEDARK